MPHDIGWKHCTIVQDGKIGRRGSVLVCDYCGRRYNGGSGIHQIKVHLARIGWAARACPNVPPQVEELMKRDLGENAQKKGQQPTASEHIQDGRKKEQFEMPDRTEECHVVQMPNTELDASSSSMYKKRYREREDISWKYCTEISKCRKSGIMLLECNFCGRRYRANGVYRIKLHLAHTSKDAKGCPNVPPEVKDLLRRDLGENKLKKQQQQQQQPAASEHIQIVNSRDNSSKNCRKDGKKKEQEFEMQDNVEELLQCQSTPTVHGNKKESKFEGASFHVILERVRSIEAQLQPLQHLEAVELKMKKLEQLTSTQLKECKSEMLQGFTLLSHQIKRSFGMPEANMDHTEEAINFQTDVVFPHALDFPSFTELEKKAIIYALFNPVGPLDENLVILWKSHLTRSELLCMRDGKWVSSAVVNCVVDVLVHEQFVNGLVKRHYFPTYFAEKILIEEPPSLEELKAFYQPSILKYDLLQCELLFIPLCVDSHWFVYVINLRDKRVEVLNSLPMSGFTVELNYMSRMKEACNEIMSSLSGRPMGITEWPVLLPELPIQKTNYDCGIFMICYMEYWDGRLMKSFAQDHIPYLRMRIIADLLLHPENKGHSRSSQ